MNLSNISHEYDEKGFIVIKSLISNEDNERFLKIAKSYDSGETTNENISYFPHPIRFFDPRMYKQFSKWLSIQFYRDCFFLSTRTKQKNFQSVINSLDYDGFKKISRIDSYISKKSQDDPTEWHTDQAFGGATNPAEFFGGTSGLMSMNNINRLFIHSTSVQYLNGCFSYIPYSHKINISMRKLINSGKVRYKPFYLLEDAVNLVKGDYHRELLTLCTKEEIDQFINHGSNALKSDKDYVLECEAGDAVLFNDFGYHKGTAPQSNDRIVFRYWY